ncbi:hypothetical protein KMP13_04465 [Epibacterium ulvae]|uniref:hypothetical protein n=1 Tax=Epibacterium ulvae TaxID=1156985 RepID=UPI001BFC8477|nr:hypothetical protein [Epibacterium ulvae]MBT8153154.1 hypothetical protein [Epibacterium ulvae]
MNFDIVFWLKDCAGRYPTTAMSKWIDTTALMQYILLSLKTALLLLVRGPRCAAQSGGGTYMLGDAKRDMIAEIPSDLLPKCPLTGDTWECTRFVADDKLQTSDQKMATKLVVAGPCDVAKRRGAQRLLSLSPPTLGRYLSSFGYSVQRIGDGYKCGEDGRSYNVFLMDCDPGVNRNMFETYQGGNRQTEGHTQEVAHVLLH